MQLFDKHQNIGLLNKTAQKVQKHASSYEKGTCVIEPVYVENELIQLSNLGEHCSLVTEAFVYYRRNQLQKEKIWKVYFQNADVCHGAAVSQIVTNKADLYVVP